MGPCGAIPWSIMGAVLHHVTPCPQTTTQISVFSQTAYLWTVLDLYLSLTAFVLILKK